MAQISRMLCCGTKEVTGVSHDPNPATALRSLINNYRDVEMNSRRALPAQFIFTQARRGRREHFRAYGDQLADYITERGLGEVIRSREGRNPNTGAQITTYVWTPNKGRVTSWLRTRS